MTEILSLIFSPLGIVIIGLNILIEIARMYCKKKLFAEMDRENANVNKWYAYIFNIEDYFRKYALIVMTVIIVDGFVYDLSKYANYILPSLLGVMFLLLVVGYFITYKEDLKNLNRGDSRTRLLKDLDFNLCNRMIENIRAKIRNKETVLNFVKSTFSLFLLPVIIVYLAELDFENIIEDINIVYFVLICVFMILFYIAWSSIAKLKQLYKDEAFYLSTKEEVINQQKIIKNVIEEKDYSFENIDIEKLIELKKVFKISNQALSLVFHVYKKEVDNKIDNYKQIMRNKETQRKIAEEINKAINSKSRDNYL